MSAGEVRSERARLTESRIKMLRRRKHAATFPASPWQEACCERAQQSSITSSSQLPSHCDVRRGSAAASPCDSSSVRFAAIRLATPAWFNTLPAARSLFRVHHRDGRRQQAATLVPLSLSHPMPTGASSAASTRQVSRGQTGPSVERRKIGGHRPRFAAAPPPVSPMGLRLATLVRVNPACRACGWATGEVRAVRGGERCGAAVPAETSVDDPALADTWAGSHSTALA